MLLCVFLSVNNRDFNMFVKLCRCGKGQRKQIFGVNKDVASLSITACVCLELI